MSRESHDPNERPSFMDGLVIVKVLSSQDGGETGAVALPCKATATARRESRAKTRTSERAGQEATKFSFALRRGTIAQVATARDAAQRAVDKLVLNEAGWVR